MNKNDKKTDLCRALKSYSQSDICPMHMPGHKRGAAMLGSTLPYDIDITEIDGFDNLHSASGIIKSTMEKAKSLYKSEYSYILVNGSTCGILAAVRCTTKLGDDIIVARNCHKSVYNACILNNLNIHNIYPSTDKITGINGCISPQSVADALAEHPNAKAVVITSPTYEGVISDVRSIAEAAHSHGVPLIADNAHGAHQSFFGLTDGEPILSGADIVISSLHKTLPSLTQTAVAHINGSLVNPKEFEQALAIFETSSPSYVLMASIDRCFDFIAERGEAEFKLYRERLNIFSKKMKELKKLTVLCHGDDSAENHGFYSFDPGKIVICTGNTELSGTRLAELLRDKYHIELEMAYSTYALAMTSVCDSDENFNRLTRALLEIDKTLTLSKKERIIKPLPIPQKSPLKFADLPKAQRYIPLESGCGKVSLEFIFAYPPGVPLIIPGEIIDGAMIEHIKYLTQSGVNIQTSRGEFCGDIAAVF